MNVLHEILNWKPNFIDVLLLASICFLIASFNYVRKTRWHYQKYKNVPLEVSNRLYCQVATLHHSVQNTIRDQALSVWDAEFRIQYLQDIEATKKCLDEYLKFSDDLADFYNDVDEYIEFLALFFAQHKDQVRYPQFPIPLKNEKDAIHQRVVKQLQYLENELLPVANMPKSFYMHDKT